MPMKTLKNMVLREYQRKEKNFFSRERGELIFNSQNSKLTIFNETKPLMTNGPGQYIEVPP